MTSPRDSLQVFSVSECTGWLHLARRSSLLAFLHDRRAVSTIKSRLRVDVYQGMVHSSHRFSRSIRDQFELGRVRCNITGGKNPGDVRLHRLDINNDVVPLQFESPALEGAGISLEPNRADEFVDFNVLGSAVLVREGQACNAAVISSANVGNS